MPEKQLSFNFEPKDEKPPEKPTEAPHEYHFEVEDECTYCGAPFESERSCVRCRTNSEKLAFSEKKKEQKH